MLDQNVASYGVVDAHEAELEFDNEFEELARIGYTIVDSGLTPEQLGELAARLDAVYDRQARAMNDLSLDASADADVARCLLAYDDLFLGLATNPILLGLSRRVFGDNFVLLQQNGVINRPTRAHYQLSWHRDLPYQHWVTSKPIAFAALLCIDPFDEMTGGTYVLPASHLRADFPSEQFVRRQQRGTVATPGSFVVMDAMTYHRAGQNVSDAPRRGINHLIGLPFLAQQIDIPQMLGDVHTEDPFLSRYLGYKWGPSASVEAWRRDRTTPHA